jgi:hypothetical protein
VTLCALSTAHYLRQVYDNLLTARIKAARMHEPDIKEKVASG